ncbi:MAG: gfo/Idh/MocA family oxidoreductase, partial [Rhodospirillaceae bacterium]
MINAGIVGLGWWGKVLVGSVQGKSDNIRFSHGATRTRANAEEYAGEQAIDLVDSYEELLALDDLDAVV